MNFTLLLSADDVNYIESLVRKQSIEDAGALHTKIVSQVSQQVRQAEEAAFREKVAAATAANEQKETPAAPPAATEDDKE